MRTLWAEIVRGVMAAWRIALFDPDAMRHFDLSERGFWRSFWAFPLCLPYLLLISRLLWHTTPDRSGGEHGFAYLFSVHVAIFALSWIGFVLAMIPMAALLRAGANYVPFVIARNWAQALLNLALIAPVSLLVLLGDASRDAVASLGLFALILTLSYGWVVARAGLAAGALSAAGVVLLELLIAVLLQLAGNALLLS